MSNGRQAPKKRVRDHFLIPFRSRARSTSPSSVAAASSVVASVITPQTSPSPLSSALSTHITSSTSQHLLQSALDRLSDQDRTLLKQQIPTASIDVNTALDQAIQVARTQQQQYQDKRWTFTLGSRTVTLQEEADKVVHWLNRFKSVGDIAANADPVHIGLPWAGIRFLLEMAVTDANQRASLLVGCELALYMSNRLKAYAEFYRRLPQTQAQINFEDALVKMYVCILQFLAQAIRTYHSSSARRVTRAFWEVSAITNFETQCHSLAMQTETEASNCDRILYQNNVQQVIDEIGKIHQAQQSLDRIEAKIDLEKLNRLPYVASAEFDAYEGDYQACHPGTRLYVLRQIMDWAQRPSGKRIFWLNGMAGTGKSTISYTIAGQLLNQAKSASFTQLGASFFFKRGENDRKSTRRLFPTIARRLAYRLPALAPILVEVISNEPDIGEKKLGEQFEKLVYCPLQTLASSMDDDGDPAIFIVVVDALDECERYEDIETLLKLWPRLSQLTKLQLRLFLTGRPDSPVLQGLDEMPIGIRQDVVLHDIPQTEITEDIALYLRDRLSQAQQHTGLGSLSDTWPSEEDLQTLLRLTVPLFICAATACRFITGNSRWNPRARLQTLIETQGTHHLSGIEKLYMTVLTQLTASCVEPNDKDIVYREFRIIVGSIIILSTPLSSRSLAKLLRLNFDDVRRCLHTLHSVLYVPPDPNMTVRYLHLSFREFLLDTGSQSGPYRVNGRDAHHTLLTHCLDLLSSQDGLKEDICGVKFPGQLGQDFDSSVIKQYLPAEIQYAIRNWVFHAQQSMFRIRDNDSVHCFLQEHFLHWFEALSILRISTTLIDNISDLQSIIATDNSETVSAFLKDARRFALSHRHVGNLAPLQLYSSAVAFSPRESLVRKLCGQVPSWMRRLPAVPQKWSAELQKLEGHIHWVEGVAFSPDGKLLASASNDLTVRLWDASTGQQVQTLEGHTREVRAVAFSPDGKLLASASDDRTVRLWNASMGQQVQTLDGHTDRVRAVAFSPDGKLLASASFDRTVRLWDASTGQQVQTLEGHTEMVNAVAFSPDGKLLASASDDRTVRLWDASTGQQVQQFTHYATAIASAAGSPQFLVASWASLSIDRALFSSDLTSSLAQTVVTVKDEWVQYQGENLLWLPHEYRSSEIAVHGNLIAFGQKSGQVSFLQLDPLYKSWKEKQSVTSAPNLYRVKVAA